MKKNKANQPATVVAGGPIGARGVSFLRRVRSVGGAYRLNGDEDRDALSHTLDAGFVVRDKRNSDLVYLTHSGDIYLDRLMRAE